MMMKLSSSLLLLGLSACATTLPPGEPAKANAEAAPAIIHELKPLAYSYDALEGAIDATTMEIHYSRHHAGYVRNLNAALADRPDLASKSLEALMENVSSLPVSIRNNGGGHYNHDLFWRLMAPVGQGGTPSRALAQQIDADFGSMEAFKTAFNAAAATQFGSGWAWLVVTDDGLKVTATPNQDNPLMDIAPVRGMPILAVDVWEHAYYLRYQNKRGEYLTSWWTVVNWNEVNRLFDAAQKK
jgi:Fe-Mn family superoxide dismutase